MLTIHDTPPAAIKNDLNNLAQALHTKILSKTDTNLLIATCNIVLFFLILIILIGCVPTSPIPSFPVYLRETRWSGYDPLAAVGFGDFCYSNSELTMAVSENFNNILGYSILNDDDKLKSELENLFEKVLKNYLFLSNEDVLFDIYNLSRHNLGYPHNYKDLFKLRLFATSKFIAFSLPNGEIFLSTSLFSNEQSFSAKNEAQKVAILAHELAHILYGHLCYQWDVAQNYNKFVQDKYIADMTQLTTMLPLQFIYQIYSLRDLSSIHHVNLLIEFQADIATGLLLKEMGYDPHEYESFLINLKDHIVDNVNIEKDKHSDLDEANKLRRIEELNTEIFWIQARIECLSQALNFKNHKLPEYLVVKSTELVHGNWGQFVESNASIAYNLENRDDLIMSSLFWCCAIQKMGRPCFIEKIIFYNNNSFMFFKDVNNPTLPIRTDNGIAYPIRTSHGIVVPNRFLELPLFRNISKRGQ